MVWGTVVGLGLEAAGDYQAAEAALAGAQGSAEIEELNRLYQMKLFSEEMARLEPRYETAREFGLPLMEQYMTDGGIDQTQMPLYNMQLAGGQDFLREQGVDSPYAMGRFEEGLTAAENDAAYARLQDMLQIGMGASGAAGQGAQNFATGQSQSLINTGNVLAQGQMDSNRQMNSMYSNLAGNIGSLPAYMSYQQGQQRPTNLSGPQIPLGGIR